MAFNLFVKRKKVEPELPITHFNDSHEETSTWPTPKETKKELYVEIEKYNAALNKFEDIKTKIEDLSLQLIELQSKKEEEDKRIKTVTDELNNLNKSVGQVIESLFDHAI